MASSNDLKGSSGSKKGGSKPSSRPTSKSSSKQTRSSQGSSSSSEVMDERKREIDRIRRTFRRLEAETSFSGIQSAKGNMESSVTKLPLELQALRDRGYAHAGRLDEQISALRRQWRLTRSRVESGLRTKGRQMRSEANETEKLVRRMSVNNSASIRTAESAVENLDSQMSAARRSIEAHYDELQSDLNAIENNLRQVREMFDVIDASSEITLRDTEGPLLCVAAEWEQDGDEGPDGFLILTDQRLVFEQKEEVAKKKRFGLFATDKELIQRLLFDVPAYEIESVKAREEGGFLGMGKDDKLELVLGASAPVARARFHLKGEDSEEWAKWIHRVKSGEIDADRDERFVEEVAEAATLMYAFPVQCPSCFASVPTPPRGAKTVTCEFCGSLIKPEEDEA